MAQVRDVYGADPEREWDRLAKDAYRELEFQVTMHLLQRHLPATGAVLDAGGGPGRYSLELCRRGYRVTLLDAAPALLDVARARFAQEPAEVQDRLQACLEGDIRDLSRFPDGIFDAVLCLGGPLTHLQNRSDRERAVRELVRVAKPGALVAVGVVGLLAVLRTVILEFSHELLAPHFEELRRLGDAPGPGGMPWHFFRAAELQELAESAGLETVTLAGCQGLSAGVREATNRLAEEPDKWTVWMDVLLETACEPAVADMAEHILYLGRRCTDGIEGNCIMLRE